MAIGNEAIIRGVASILQQASAALARLGAEAAQVQQPQLGIPASNAGVAGVAGLAGAVAALAQVAVQFSGAAAAAGAAVGGAASSGNTGVHAGVWASPAREAPATCATYEEAHVDDDSEPTMTTQEFCELHKLEGWVGEALDLLLPSQRAAVINPQMNTGRARNLNGIVVSRIKHAVPLDERLGVFVQINGLSEKVVDRISTLTQEQAEALLDSGFKIQKAENTSAVAMKRISDVIRSSHDADRDADRLRGGWDGRAATARPRPQESWGRGGDLRLREAPRDVGRDARSRTPTVHSSHGGGDTPEDVRVFMDLLGLEWWCGEVLKRLSLWQRQQIIKDLQNLQNVRNPSGVVMSRVRQVVDTSELMSIFIDINQFDRSVQEQLLALTPEQQLNVINPGIYLQNVRNPSTAVRSRMNNVLAGKDAFGKPLTP